MRLLKWYRRRRFISAYKILRNEAERHVDAGHHMTFQAINEASLDMHCFECPDLQPTGKARGKAVWGV